jgi:L-amino acid N-acyltransferase
VLLLKTLDQPVQAFPAHAAVAPSLASVSATPREARSEQGAARATMGLRLELAAPGHAEGLLAIYNREVESGTATFDITPRSREDQLEWIAEHSGAHPAVVAVTDEGEVVGFGSLSPYRPRAAYSTSVEDSVYVAEEFQGVGIGRAVLEELLRLAQAHGFHAVLARIAGDNEASVALHAACGFELIGTEHEVGRKFSRWLDVVCMERLI